MRGAPSVVDVYWLRHATMPIVTQLPLPLRSCAAERQTVNLPGLGVRKAASGGERSGEGRGCVPRAEEAGESEGGADGERSPRLHEHAVAVGAASELSREMAPKNSMTEKQTTFLC